MGTRIDNEYYEAVRPNSPAERVFIRARRRIYSDFLRVCGPGSGETILDVGVSDAIETADNIIERLYPHPELITAAGLGLGEDFQACFPKVSYRQIVANQQLPFNDLEFDIVVSNAVLEHVGSVANQKQFLDELARVGKRVYITVPNRFFPIEHHTAIPFLHWTDSAFRIACRLFGKSKWADTRNLILMSKARLRKVCPQELQFEIGTTGLTFGPLSSNLYLFIKH